MTGAATTRDAAVGDERTPPAGIEGAALGIAAAGIVEEGAAGIVAAGM